jgi:hypothetical protein
MYDVCTQIIHIQHTRMICDYFWPSFCCKIRHDDHGLVKRFRPPFFSAVLVPLPISKPGGLGWFALGSCSDCTPGQGSWALICSETTRISLVSRFWSALMWSIFMAFLRTWVIVILEKDLDSHLHIAHVFRLFQPISVSALVNHLCNTPLISLHVEWQVSNVAQQPPAPPNVPEAWAALSFLHMVLWWTEITGSYGSRGCNVVTIKRCNVPEVPSEKWCRNILEAMPNFD